MDFSEIFGADVDVRRFFFEMLPQIYEERGSDFSAFSQEPIIFSVYLKDSQERFSAELHADGVSVEDDEMIDFPLVSICGYKKYWDTVKRHSVTIAEEFDEKRENFKGQFVVTREFLDDFERIDASIDVVIFNEDEAVEMTLVLNNYDDDEHHRRFAVELPLELVEAVASTETDIVDAAKSLKIQGDMKLAMELGGLFLKYADR